MTSPPTSRPPPDDPTLVDSRRPAPRVVEEEVAGPAPVVRPYPWWLWVLAGLCLAARDPVRRPLADGAERQRQGRSVARRPERGAGTGPGVVRAASRSRPCRGRPAQPSGHGHRPGAAGRRRAREGRAGDGGRLGGAGAGDGAEARRQHGRRRPSSCSQSQGLQTTSETVDSTKPKGIVVAQDPADGDEGRRRARPYDLAVSNGNGTGQGSCGAGHEPGRRRRGDHRRRARRPS